MPDSTLRSEAPSLELRPLRNGVASDRATTLDLMLTVHGPRPEERSVDRPPLNLALVIDRSGSMTGQKLEYAKAAARFAVAQLLPRDRVAIVAYDSEVHVLVPSTPASDQQLLLSAIDRIHAGSTTALHAGWVEGGVEVGRHLTGSGTHRVLLLSDGLANVGETNADRIASDVRGLCDTGIGTSTMGVGDHYDEALLEAMAEAGGGNFYHIQSPRQLPDFFASELEELVTLFSARVSLSFSSASGVEVVDLLNDLERLPEGGWRLPAIVAGSSVKLLLRLRVPALGAAAGPASLGSVRLGWRDAGAPGEREVVEELRLPVIPSPVLESLPIDEEVQELAVVLEAQRDKRQMIEHLRAGRMAEARRSIDVCAYKLRSAPQTELVADEMAFSLELADHMDQGEHSIAGKKALYQRHARRHGRDVRPSD